VACHTILHINNPAKESEIDYFVKKIIMFRMDETICDFFFQVNLCISHYSFQHSTETNINLYLKTALKIQNDLILVIPKALSALRIRRSLS
jgi:hypothetical protein